VKKKWGGVERERGIGRRREGGREREGGEVEREKGGGVERGR
jgi:hypothetical protein